MRGRHTNPKRKRGSLAARLACASGWCLAERVSHGSGAVQQPLRRGNDGHAPFLLVFHACCFIMGNETPDARGPRGVVHGSRFVADLSR